MESIKKVFSKAVLGCEEISSTVTEWIQEMRDIEEHVLDHTYFDFLEEQVQLNARGEAWNERLAKRKQNLESFVSQPLVRGLVPLPSGDLYIEVEPLSLRVVHWEEYSTAEGFTASMDGNMP